MGQIILIKSGFQYSWMLFLNISDSSFLELLVEDEVGIIDSHTIEVSDPAQRAPRLHVSFLVVEELGALHEAHSGKQQHWSGKSKAEELDVKVISGDELVIHRQPNDNAIFEDTNETDQRLTPGIWRYF